MIFLRFFFFFFLSMAFHQTGGRRRITNRNSGWSQPRTNAMARLPPKNLRRRAPPQPHRQNHTVLLPHLPLRRLRRRRHRKTDSFRLQTSFGLPRFLRGNPKGSGAVGFEPDLEAALVGGAELRCFQGGDCWREDVCGLVLCLCAE